MTWNWNGSILKGKDSKEKVKKKG